MRAQSINTVCNGDCYVKKIVVLASAANPNLFICRKGDKLMDRLFYITKGVFYIKEKGSPFRTAQILTPISERMAQLPPNQQVLPRCNADMAIPRPYRLNLIQILQMKKKAQNLLKI